MKQRSPEDEVAVTLGGLAFSGGGARYNRDLKKSKGELEQNNKLPQGLR